MSMHEGEDIKEALRIDIIRFISDLSRRIVRDYKFTTMRFSAVQIPLHKRRCFEGSVG